MSINEKALVRTLDIAEKVNTVSLLSYEEVIRIYVEEAAKTTEQPVGKSFGQAWEALLARPERDGSTIESFTAGWDARASVRESCDELMATIRMCEDTFRFIAEMHGKVENADAAKFKKASGDIVTRCTHSMHHIANKLEEYRKSNEIEDGGSK